MSITPRQIGRLQTLYGQLARHTIGVGTGREERLAYVSARMRRPIASFKDLSVDDAGWLVDQLQGELGVKAPAKPSKRLDREQGRRAGLDGRKDGGEFATAPQMASAADLATIQSYYMRLGLTREQFDGWLRSAHSPLKHKSDPKIVTLSDANKVRWALKGRLQAAGLWEERRKS